MYRCSNCGSAVDKMAQFCSQCGQPFTSAATSISTGKCKRNRLPILIASLAVVLFLLLIVLFVMLAGGFGSESEADRKSNRKPLSGKEASQATEMDEATDPTLSNPTDATIADIGSDTPTLPTGPNQSDTPIDPSVNNPYWQYLDIYPTYILPYSNTTYLSAGSIKNLSATEQTLALQEIYARYGVTSADSNMQAFFEARSWYVPKNDAYTLNQWETANVILLQTYIALGQGTLNNPYLTAVPEDYAVANSSAQLLTELDLLSCSATKLVVARNEIYARHGYVFSDTELQAYFCTKSWYTPSVKGSEFDSGVLSSTELKNISLIKTMQPYAGENGCVINQARVSSQYTYYIVGYCNHIPTISNVPNADALNQQINDNHKDQPDYTFTNYTLHQTQHIVSLAISSIGPSDIRHTSIYNFSAVTGQSISDSDLYAALGLTQEDVNAAIRRTLEQELDHHWASTMTAESQAYYREKTLSEENIQATRAYLDNDGNLWFSATVFTNAGNGRYYTRFPYDPQVSFTPGCPNCGAIYQ